MDGLTGEISPVTKRTRSKVRLSAVFFLGVQVERFEPRNKCQLHRLHLFATSWINRFCRSSVDSEEESDKTSDLLESLPAFPPGPGQDIWQFEQAHRMVEETRMVDFYSWKEFWDRMQDSEAKISKVQQKKQALENKIDLKLSVQQKQELAEDMRALETTDIVLQRTLRKLKEVYEQGYFSNMPFRPFAPTNYLNEAVFQSDVKGFEQMVLQAQEKYVEIQDQEVRNRKLELLEKEKERSCADGRLCPLQEQEAVQAELRDVKSALLTLQQEVARITSHHDASSSCGDSSSVVTVDSWIHVGSSKPCCFLPDTHFQVVTDDG